MTVNPNGSGTDSVRLISGYLSDDQVDPRLDAAIRQLLCRCFTAPEHERFRAQRFFYDPYPHRWVLKAEDGQLIGHGWLRGRGVLFAILFGEVQVYQSSGYRPVELFLEHPPPGLPQPLPALVRPLANIDWPADPPLMTGALY